MKQLITLLLFLLTLAPITDAKAQGDVAVKVDSRIELLRIVWNMAILKNQSKDMQPIESEYKKMVDDYFRAYRKHKAVKTIKKTNIYDYSFPYLGLELDEEFNLPETRSPKLEEWFSKYGEGEMKEVFALIKDFAIESDFANFFQSNDERYQEMVDPAQAFFEKKEWVVQLSDFFRTFPPNKVIIYFDPLNNIGNSEIGGSQDEMVMGMAYLGKRDSKKTDKVQFEIEGWTQRIFYHEAVHYYTSAATYLNSDGLSTVSNLFVKETEADSDNEAIWMKEIDETIVRAITAYLFKIYVNEQVGENEINDQLDTHKYAGRIYRLLDEYHQNPNTYKRFEDFHPEIIGLILRL